MDATARALGGDVRALWTGYRVQRGEARVEWRGGLSGAYTRVRVGRDVRVRDGLLGPDAVLGLLATLEAGRR